MIRYPDTLPAGLVSGRTYQTVSPLQRTEMTTGRARQRRRFTSVPVDTTLSWIFNDEQAVAFEAWFRDALNDGADWFEMPLGVPMGFDHYVCRFTDIYAGPSRIGKSLWGYSAPLEIRERPLPLPGFGLFPDYIVQADIFDVAMNDLWPLNPWQRYADAADKAINEDWPTP